MANIYELTSDFLKVQEMIEQGEYNEETLLNTLECIDFEIEEKANGYAKIIRNISSDAEGIKAEEKRLNDRRKAMESSINKLKENLYTSMKATGKEKFKTDMFSFAIQKNPASLKIIEGRDIPIEFLIEQEPKIDTMAIKEKLKNGDKLDFAELIQGEGLRIR